MPRYRRPPLSLDELYGVGPPVRVRDLVALSGLSTDTIYQDIDAEILPAVRRNAGGASPYLIARTDARAWLAQVGISPNLHGNHGTSDQPSSFVGASCPHCGHPMSLATKVRSAVALADRVSKPIQVDVDHEAGSAPNVRGDITYDTAVARKATWEPRVRAVRRPDGTFAQSLGKLTFLSNVAVGTWDRFTVPQGATAADIQGAVLEIKGVGDPAGGNFALEVWLG